MKRVLITAAIIFGTGSLALAQAAKSGDKELAEKGLKVYTDQKCSMCHSIGGRGNAKGPLDTVGSKLSAEELRQWIVDAKGMTAKTKAPRAPAMKNYDLPKADVDALVAYMQTLKDKGKK